MSESQDSSLNPSLADQSMSRSNAPPELPPRKVTPQSSFIEEEKAIPEPPPRPKQTKPSPPVPIVVEQPATPPALPDRISTPTTAINMPSSPVSPRLSTTATTAILSTPTTASLASPTATAPNELRRRQQQQKAAIADIVPDLHGIVPSQGLSTDIHTHNAINTRQTITAAEQKPVPPSFPGTFVSQQNSRRPDWYRTGWNAANKRRRGKRSGGARYDALEEWLPDFLYGAWYHHGMALFITAFVSFLLAKVNAGIGSLLLFCLCVANYYRMSIRRFRANARDDIQREISKYRMESDEESVEWMNNFIERFWLIFEPVLSALVVENLDNYITDYLPSFLDSIRLTTFTLGSKPFRIETIKTYANADPDTVCMDCKVSFIPNDLSDLSAEELNNKVNPKIIMQVRFGGRRVGAAFPVLLEDLTFAGHLRVKIKLMGRYPFIRTLEASFLDKPEFDYVLKPLGTDTFGLDVNFIPGLQSFIREQVHNILGPLMYAPNVFTVDVEKVLAGDFDLSSANGLLAVTVYSAERIKNVNDIIDETPNPYIRFYLDHGQELDRTSICESTYSPTWNETRYLKLNNLNSILSLELKTSRPGFKDRRLGTANFDLSQLDDESQAEQEGLNLLLLRNGKHVSDLRVDVRYLPISKPTKRDDGTIEPAVDSNSGVLRLNIHECRDLESSEGAVSPYVRIIVNGVEKKKTAVMRKKRDPKYEEPYEIVVLDKTTFYIRAEVRDSANNDVLLGVFSSYLLDMMRQQESNSSWWKLMNEEKQVGELRLSAEWKPVIMTGLSDFSNSHGFDQPPIGAIRFTLWEARDLRNVGMGGKSDPYIRVLSGSQIRGRTEVVENNLNPEWGESLYVPVHSLKEIFVLEAMDWNAKSKDKSLGMTEFKASEIIQQQIGQQSVDPDVWYEANGVEFNKWQRLRSIDRRSTKGELHFSAEFFPVLGLPKSAIDVISKNSQVSSYSAESSAIASNNNSGMVTATTTPALPLRGLHGSFIRYTPDDLVDLNSYNSGVLKIHIMDVQLSNTAYCYCQVIVDSLMPCYKTAKLRGLDLKFDEYADAFIKEADFSRIAIEIKPAHSTEKDVHKLGHWIDSGSAIIRRIMRRKRMGLDDDDEGTWFKLMGTDGPARIKLGFEYEPMENFVLNPDESLDNQGTLTVDLLSATNLMAADKSGTSDPYVIFTVNGEKVHKSETIKKTLNPKWRNERFTVPIQSRVTASIRIEVFDWNHVKGHTSIGSGGITLRGDAVEPFGFRLVDIPLDGIAGVSGTVQVRFTWQPQLLASNKRQKTSVLATTRTYLHDDVNLEASGPLIRDSRLTVGGGGANGLSSIESVESAAGGGIASPRSSYEESNLSRTSLDDGASISAVSFADTAALSDATGKPGIVMITLMEARGLRGVDKSGTSDPYVRVLTNRGQIYKTKVIPKTLAPVWNETFTHGVGGEPFVFDFKVKDHNKFKSSVDLGHSTINIWDLIKPDIPGGDTFSQWLPLFPPGSGEIAVHIHFKPTM